MNLAHVVLPLSLVFGMACQSAASGEPELQEASPEARGAEQAEAETWSARGVIKRIERDRGTITIHHEDVPGYMPSMTMPFWVESDALFDGLAVDDAVAFRFRRGEGGKHFIVSIEKR
jgi:protein SCO1